MFDSLSEKLEGALQSVSGQGRINEINVAETMREIRRALLNADVNFQVAREFTSRVKEKALGEDVLTSVTPGQQLTKIVYDELTHFLGEEHEGIEMADQPPTVILVAGLQGSGKTTFCAKLAKHYVKEGHAPLLAAADVYRPAAVDQLQKLASEASVPVYSVQEDDGTIVQDAVRVADEAVSEARRTARDIVIIDTAGRMHIDEQMMQEVTDIKTTVEPDEILFVVDSMTGQDAVNTAKEFNEQLDYDGVVLTKLDGDARGGAALSVRQITGAPIKFMGTGEKLDGLEAFHPDRVASRILGMGDVLSLVEEVQTKVDQKQARRMAGKMGKASKRFTLDDMKSQLEQMSRLGGMGGLLSLVEDVQRKVDQKQARRLAGKVGKGSRRFGLDDFKNQLEQMEKLGGLGSLAEKMPGMGNLPEAAKAQLDDKRTRCMIAIVNSMTPKERRYPDTINGSRKRRIAQGSGTQIQDVNRLLKQHKQMQKMMKKAGSGKLQKMMQNMPGGGMPGGGGGMPF